MIPLFFLSIAMAFPNHGTNACLPRRTKELTDSYVPVGIQALSHYKSQLQLLYPYAYSALCEEGKQTMAIMKFPLRADVCVAESVARINLFLIDLQRAAVEQNLKDSQGLTRSVLNEITKTSEMTAAQQLYFILRKLQKEQTGSKSLWCKIRGFLQDLENSNTKLYRNLMNVKPLKFLK